MSEMEVEIPCILGHFSFCMMIGIQRYLHIEYNNFIDVRVESDLDIDSLN